jgi:hypothetical protein
MIRRLLLLTIGAMACASTRSLPPFQYELAAWGFLPPEACTVKANFPVPRREFRRWDGRIDLQFRRVIWRNGQRLVHDSTIRDQRVRLERIGSGHQWRLVLGTPLADTISLTDIGRNASTGAWGFDGQWACGHRYPFADDSTGTPTTPITLKDHDVRPGPT